MTNKAEFADHLLTTLPGPDDWAGWVDLWCREDTGNIDCVPNSLRSSVEHLVTPEGWLKMPDTIPNTPYKIARWRSGVKPPWAGTGLSPEQMLEWWSGQIAGDELDGAEEYPDLYFIGSHGGPIKIGISIDPMKRLRTLQTGYPFKLQLYAVIKGAGLQEPEYHARFAEHRLEGEWFAPHPDILAEIERISPADVKTSPNAANNLPNGVQALPAPQQTERTAG